MSPQRQACRDHDAPIDVVWNSRQTDLQGVERCRLAPCGSGWRMTGEVHATSAGHPLTMRYEVTVDRDWLTRRATIRLDHQGEVRRRRLRRLADGTWHVDGRPVPDLQGCTDIDLSLTPATNTPPIRRLTQQRKGERHIQVAWVAAPALGVRRTSQHYRCVASGTWHYTAGTYSTDVEVDDNGLVLRYGDNLWTQAHRGQRSV